jgi:hypothetical protein
MPWLTCTTGSPIFSSERSLISASTLETCSCLRRRRTCGVAAKSSVSVMNWIGAPAAGVVQTKPAASGAAVIAMRSSPGLELGQRGHAGHVDAVVAQQIEQALAPALALGHQQHAVRRGAQVLLEGVQRLGGGAVDADVGQRARPVQLAAAAQRQRGMRLRQREELLGRRKRSCGASSGRSRSCCRKRWRSRVSAQKRSSAGSISPCSTSVAAAPR